MMTILLTSVVLTVGAGTSHPDRPGNPSVALETGVLASLGDWGVRVSGHQEGDGTHRFEGTATVFSAGAFYSPSVESNPSLLLRAELYGFLLVDVVPTSGLGVDGVYGWRSRSMSVGVFANWHSAYYDPWPALAGLTTGVEARWWGRFHFASVRVGTVGGIHPYASATVGVGYRWE